MQNGNDDALYSIENLD